MPRFTGSDFSIELPENCRDESTYALVLPMTGNFRPSVVVKTERLAFPVEVGEYAADQRRAMTSAMPGMVVSRVERLRQDGLTAEECEWEWGEDGRRVRQRQRYILLAEPDRVVTITGTATPETFAEVAGLFADALASFRSLGGRTIDAEDL